MVFVSTAAIAITPAALARPELRERSAKTVARPPPEPRRPPPPRKRRPPKPKRTYQPPTTPLPSGQLRPEELLPLAHEYAARIHQVATQTQTMVSEARKVSDPIRVNCLLDKLFQVKNHRVVAEQALERFQRAVVAKTIGLDFRDFNKLAASHQAALHFEQQAALCPFQPAIQSEVIIKKEDLAPEEEGPRPPGYAIPERPPGASPII